MTGLTKQQVVAYLESLRPAELRDLLHELEERWGVERLVLPQPATVDLDRSTMGVPEFDVLLLEHGGERIAVMKALRQHLHVPLRAAKQIIDSLPYTVAEGLRLEHARVLRELLEAAGARVKLR